MWDHTAYKNNYKRTAGKYDSSLLQGISQPGIWNCLAFHKAIKEFWIWSDRAFHSSKTRASGEERMFVKVPSLSHSELWSASWTCNQLLMWFNCCLGFLPWQKSHFQNMHFFFLFHRTVFVTAWSGAIVKQEAYVLIYLTLKCHLETSKGFKCWHLDKILLQWICINELHFRRILIYVVTLILVEIIIISITWLSH